MPEFAEIDLHASRMPSSGRVLRRIETDLAGIADGCGDHAREFGDGDVLTDTADCPFQVAVRTATVRFLPLANPAGEIIRLPGVNRDPARVAD